MLDLNDTPQSFQYDLHDLNQRLADLAYKWVPAYFPRGIISKNRRELRLANISGDGPRNEGSCVVGLRGEHAGENWDFQTEKGGSPLDTLSHATGLLGRELFAKAAEIVGGARPRGRPPATKPNGHAKSVAAEHILLATSIWDSTQDPYKTSTERYITTVRGLGPFPSSTKDLRHCELCTDYAAKIARPAMIARIRRANTGEPTGGIHRTYLLEDGHPAKEAMGGRHKMALGPAQLEGGVVMLAPITADGRLGVAEGIETALAMTEINRRATGESFPIWATLGDWGMANMPFPPGLKQLLIFADGGQAGVNAAERLQGRALAAGIEATYHLPKSGDDFARDLELRLWETNPGDSPSVSPPAAAPTPPRAPSEGSNLEQAPAWSVSAGPVPPQTLDAILAAATSLTRNLSPETRQNILFILRGAALAGLDSIGERQALDAIKTKTGMPIGDLRRQLAGFRREMGLVTARPAAAWASSLIMKDDGTPRAVMANAITALSEDAAFRDAIRYDKLLCQTMLTAPTPWEQSPSRPWEDKDDRETQAWLQHNGIMVSLDATRDAVQVVADRNPYHPIMNYFNGIHWDGKPRLDTWLIDYLGAEDTPYIRAIGPCWMISGIARIYRPGCQVDTALVVEGPQGTFKSSVFAVLGGEWYTSDIAPLGTKNAQEQIIGVWIVELDEMDAVTRAADIAAVKSFISRRFDRFRYTWGRRVAVYQRQCIVGGTVNKDTWQRDETGGRRWFPVKCGIIQIDLLIEDRDHLWAEARDRYLTGEKWHLEEPELVEAARVEVDKRYQPDVWEEKIASFVAPLTDVRFDDILGECCLNIPLDRWNKRHQQRVGAVLRRLGWIRKLVRLPGQPQSLIPRWRWLREVK